ncbi:CLUMA_CG008224, isoform A [Clunio marinus]|uniref:CLUMA_CG008224, isoform A n=1 Tax=Clunio marinus TaxID=568069 RepID=A0A1J1I562_9DIPT|nr:CLUMA_CG008224, isoform A [Clunio marinus]
MFQPLTNPSTECNKTEINENRKQQNPLEVLKAFNLDKHFELNVLILLEAHSVPIISLTRISLCFICKPHKSPQPLQYQATQPFKWSFLLLGNSSLSHYSIFQLSIDLRLIKLIIYDNIFVTLFRMLQNLV